MLTKLQFKLKGSSNDSHSSWVLDRL